MIWMLVACFEPPVSADVSKLEVTPPIVAPVQPAAPEPTAQTVSCTDDERQRLTCELSTGKRMSLCQGEGGLSFRYGDTRAELQIPATGHGPLKQERSKKGDGETITTVPVKGDLRYVITATRNEDQFDVLLEVYRDRQRLQTSECIRLEGIDFTE